MLYFSHDEICDSQNSSSDKTVINIFSVHPVADISSNFYGCFLFLVQISYYFQIFPIYVKLLLRCEQGFMWNYNERFDIVYGTDVYIFLHLDASFSKHS